jgi:hypothetical protein
MLFFAGCATLSTNDEPDQVSLTVSVEAVPAATPISAGGDPAQLLRCQMACQQGGQSLKNFCATVPHPAMRATCYGFLIVGEVACLGWCYNHWGY